MAETLTRSREFAAQHADLDETLRRAHNEGHGLADEARDHLLKTDRVDVAYWLAKPENRRSRDVVHNLTGKPQRQIAELDKIAAKLDRERPFAAPTLNLSETDQQLQQQRQDIRAGKRRR